MVAPAMAERLRDVALVFILGNVRPE
jgi:hypothetical protein